MARRFLVAIIVLLLALPPARAVAWGAEGHRVIAALAYERLTPKANAAVAELISHTNEQGTPACMVSTLMDAATWPDCVRPLHHRFDALAVMHYETPQVGRKRPSDSDL